MAIVSAFAGQAAMAVNGVKLVQELEARGAELAKKVDELEALREVGEAVSSSLDVDQRARHHRHARRRALGDRRRLDHGVRRAGPLLPGAQRLPDGARRRRAAAGRSGSTSTRPWSAAPPGSAGRSPCRTWRRSTSTRTCRSSTTTAGGRWSRCRCCARARSSGRSSSAASGPATSPRRPSTCSRRSRASPRWPCSTPSSSASSRSRAWSWRSPAGTSRSSSPACPTSCGRRSTPCSGSPRCCSSGCSASINERQEEYLRDIHGSGQPPAGAAQRDPRPVEGRGRARWSWSTRRSTCGPLLDDAASMLRERAAAHGGRALASTSPTASTSCTPTSSGSSRSCST